MAERAPRYRVGVTYYHGGPPGLTEILPRSQTGARALVQVNDSRRLLYPPYRVTLTTELRVAEAYAARWASRTGNPAGTVYQVRPGPDLDIDIDEPEAWACDSAQVLAVVCSVPVVRLRELAPWQARWHDEHPRHDRLMSDFDREAYTRRAIRRAVDHGEDEQQVTAEHDRAAEATIAAMAAVTAPPRHLPGSPNVIEVNVFIPPDPRSPSTRFYHGGVPGLTEILPRSANGRPPAVEYGDWRQFFYPPTLVSVTTYRLVAETYAAGAAHRHGLAEGTVYQVRPAGELDIDLDEPSGWTCDSAEVTGVAGTVPVTRLAELMARHAQWLETATRRKRIPTRAARAEYIARVVRRAVQNGHDEAAVMTMFRDGGVCR